MSRVMKDSRCGVDEAKRSKKILVDEFVLDGWRAPATFLTVNSVLLFWLERGRANDIKDHRSI